MSKQDTITVRVQFTLPVNVARYHCPSARNDKALADWFREYMIVNGGELVSTLAAPKPRGLHASPRSDEALEYAPALGVRHYVS